MTLKECYATLEADYDGVMGRLMTEERVARFLGKFLNESVFDELAEAVDGEKWEEAFRASHNMKGVCQNLGISKLGESSSELCETMRNGAPAVDITPYFDKVKEDYDRTIQVLRALIEGR